VSEDQELAGFSLALALSTHTPCRRGHLFTGPVHLPPLFCTLSLKSQELQPLQSGQMATVGCLSIFGTVDCESTSAAMLILATAHRATLARSLLYCKM